MTSARIAFCGNVANALFPIVCSLRARGLDAHLFIDRNDPPRSRPESDDPRLRGNYPDWIHEGPWFSRTDWIHPGRSALVPELNGFDLVVGSGNTPTIAPFIDAPFAFFTTGADITKQPFPWAFRHTRRGPIDQIGHVALAFWQRRGIAAVDQIWTQPFAPFLDAIDRLDVDRSKVADTYFPLIVDTDLFTPTTGPLPSFAAELRSESDFVVFHPSRLVLDESPIMLRSGQTKGSRSILRGFADFVRRESCARPTLILPALDDGASEAAAEIDRLGISDNIVWAEAPRASGFHRSEMVHLYNAADVTVNELGAGWFGWAALESMSCGTPVLSRIDRRGIEQLYGDDWEWLHVQDDAALADRLDGLARSRDQLAEAGQRSRSWILRHHARETAGDRITTSVLNALAQLRVESRPRAATG